MIVELKLRFSLALFHQGIARLKVSDHVYVAVPRGTGRPFQKALAENLALARRLGLGLITVRPRDAMVEGPSGVHVLSGGVGRDVLTNPTRRQLDRLFRALAPLETAYDLVVVDLGAGLGFPVLTHLAAAQSLVLVTGHEAPALSDGYALYKRALRLNPRLRIGLILNRAPS